MKFALLGIDADVLALAREVTAIGDHSVVAAYDLGGNHSAVSNAYPNCDTSDDWESLLHGTVADAVIVSGQPQEAEAKDRRDEQLCKLAGSGLPLLVVHPCCPTIIGFEMEMNRVATNSIMLPYHPGYRHPLLDRLRESVASPESSPVGRIQQILFDRSCEAVSLREAYSVLSQDVSVIQTIVGPIKKVAAVGMAEDAPTITGLNINLTDEDGRLIRWANMPTQSVGAGVIRCVGERGTMELSIPAQGNDWQLTTQASGTNAKSNANDSNQESNAGSPTTECTPQGWNSHSAAASDFLDAVQQARHQENSEWLNACRTLDIVQLIPQCLRRGRTVELHNEEPSEANSFKGVMAVGGCLSLFLVLGVLFLVVLVEAFQPPFRHHPLWRAWPIFLAVPIVAFLALQVLQVFAKRSDDGPDDEQLS